MLQSLLRMVIFHSSASLLEDTSFPISHPALQVTVNWDSPTLSHRAAVKYQRFASNAGKEIAQATWKGEKPIGKRSNSHPNLSKCPGVWKWWKPNHIPLLCMYTEHMSSNYILLCCPPKCQSFPWRNPKHPSSRDGRTSGWGLATFVLMWFWLMANMFRYLYNV